MKRKMIILFVALTTFLSAFSGLASLLATGPDSAPIVVAEARPKIKPPVRPLPPPPPLSPNGGSWGG